MKISYLQIAALSILLISCGNDNSNESGQSNFSRFGGNGARQATSVETNIVEVGQIADQVRSFGNVKAQNVISVLPQVSNRITEIYVDLGDTVRQGEALAKIYDATFRDQLSQAESQLEQSRIALRRDSSEYQRQQSLMERDLTSESELDIAQAAYQSSRAQFESARSSLTQAQEDFNNTIVRSPVDGVITNRALEVGDLATTGTELFQIASTNGYESRIYLPVQDWRAVKVGQEVNLRVSNERGISAEGVVSRKSPQLDATTGLGEVVITLTTVGNAVYPGVLAENVINITTKDRALIVPRSALVEQVETVINPESNTIELERSYSVFVSRGDSVAERRELELGIEQGDRIEVLSGLLPNDRIIVTGQSGLDDGARINVATGDQFQAPQERQIGGNANESGRQAPLANMNMTDEERAAAREKMQNMSREERMAYLRELRQQQADSTSNGQ
ncbi:MAG: efflux RND transporter periplasmic adaptor subunit [Gracilimonas sp.]|uniref:efflux RND transporter periplasmic adaptor subunit n=1 Tax=Gracilimonas TaxID=649462 RepID=UPI001B14431C|nr:efflux RND transporter periplasmic adaptor subunit [Gracilimonas sp.]MBO6585291.1 efflux RND transporter periplasmic adaptor subunit [Gracilimonas sp.]MBO6616287.1 efflux RND transporter periplasmic adaptor subunit [Gracilimonas sp.]